jgi:hypothetical protein
MLKDHLFLKPKEASSGDAQISDQKAETGRKEAHYQQISKVRAQDPRKKSRTGR